MALKVDFLGKKNHYWKGKNNVSKMHAYGVSTVDKWLRTQQSLCESVISIPGFAQWVRDPKLLQAAMEWVSDMAWIHCCLRL